MTKTPATITVILAFCLALASGNATAAGQSGKALHLSYPATSGELGNAPRPSSPAAAAGQPEKALRPFSTREKVLLGGLAVTMGVLETRDILVPSTCRWCAPNGLDDFFRDRLRISTLDGRRTAARWSDLTGYGSVPLMIGLAALAAPGGNHQAIETNSLTVLEAGLVAAAVSQIPKRLTARERPYRRNPDPRETSLPDDNMSFYSGHTTLGFAVAVAAGRVADLEGYRAAPAIWATGLTLAAGTGYLRIASDKHYFTDVVAGALTGSAVGLLVANHRRAHPPASPDQGTSLHLSLRTDGRSIALVVH